MYKGVFSFYPLKIGDFVEIGASCVVEAASIGSFVRIGRNCVVGRFAIIKECCQILDDSVIPSNTVVPPFSVFGGNPARFLGEVGESWEEVVEEFMREHYHTGFVGK